MRSEVLGYGMRFFGKFGCTAVRADGGQRFGVVSQGFDTGVSCGVDCCPWAFGLVTCFWYSLTGLGHLVAQKVHQDQVQSVSVFFGNHIKVLLFLLLNLLWLIPLLKPCIKPWFYPDTISDLLGIPRLPYIVLLCWGFYVCRMGFRHCCIDWLLRIPWFLGIRWPRNHPLHSVNSIHRKVFILHKVVIGLSVLTYLCQTHRRVSQYTQQLVSLTGTFRASDKPLEILLRVLFWGLDIFGLLWFGSAVEEVLEVNVDYFGLFEHREFDGKYKEEIRIELKNSMFFIFRTSKLSFNFYHL